MPKKELIDITAQLRHETDKAYLIYDGRSTKDKEITTWVPKSQVEYDGDKTFTMPEWLALEKGFI
jgi:hypothetical protein